jgi:hypothetical protein
MKPGMNFEHADAELREVGEAVLRFLTVISEAHPDDVAAVLVGLENWRPGQDLSSPDLATLMGTMDALRLRMVHGERGEKPRPELVMLDTATARQH